MKNENHEIGKSLNWIEHQLRLFWGYGGIEK